MLNRNNFAIARLAPKPDDDATTIPAGILVTPNGTQVTDGRIAVMVSAPEVQPTLFPPTDGIEPAEFWTEFVLDRESALRIEKAIPRKGDISSRIAAVDTSTENNGSATIAVNENIRQDILRASKVGGTYPAVPKAFPDPEKAKFTIAFTPALLASLLKEIERFCKDSEAPRVTLRLYDMESGMRLDAEDAGQKLQAVIMPMRFVE